MKQTALKSKQGKPSANSINKQVKKNRAEFYFGRVFGFFEIQKI